MRCPLDLNVALGHALAERDREPIWSLHHYYLQGRVDALSWALDMISERDPNTGPTTSAI